MSGGGSTTANGGDFSYPRQLENILNSNSHNINFKVLNKGIPGATSALVLSQLEKNIKEHDPDMIIIMIGLNDAVGFSKSPAVSAGKGFFIRLKIYKLAKALILNTASTLRKIFSGKEKAKPDIELFNCRR